MGNSYVDLITRAIEEVRKAQSISIKEMGQYPSPSWPLLPTINFPEGDFTFVTKEGLETIYRLGDKWYDELTEKQKSSIAKNRVRNLAVSVFGELIKGLYSSEINSNHVKDFKERLNERLTRELYEVIHHLPCHIFQDTSIGIFEVGPVKFWPRLNWLDQVELTAERKITGSDQLRFIWSGRKLPKAGKQSGSIARVKAWVEMWLKKTFVKLKREKNDRLNMYSDVARIEGDAKTILDGIGSCLWVATIIVKENESNKSKERAHTAMRLALDSLSVLLDFREALKLRGPTDVLRTVHAFTMTQIRGKNIRYSQSFDMPGISGKLDDIKELVKNSAPYRRVAGEALQAMISESDVNVPQLKKRWCEALYWYGESCRDVADFMAIAHYGMTLDILAKGRGEKAIVKLVSALLGCRPNDQFLSDGRSLEKTVDIIYKEFRSQLSHGGRFGLLQELTIERRTVNIIVAIILERYVFCLSVYDGQDDYESFLKEIPSLILKIKDVN